MSIVLGYDHGTLRERVDLVALGERLDELGEQRSSAALNEKVTLLRLAERLDEAWDVANEAVRQARFTGDREQLVLARVRRAQVQQYLGKREPALIELSDCATEAGAHDWASTEAFALHSRGLVHYELQDYPAALRDYRDALTIRVRIRATPEEVDGSMLAIAVIEPLLEAAAQPGPSAGLSNDAGQDQNVAPREPLAQ